MATVLTSCCSTFVEAQTATVIPANEAAAHVNEYATVEGIVAKVFTSKSGNTFLNIGATGGRREGWAKHIQRKQDL
jgi:hypothetical protein